VHKKSIGNAMETLACKFLEDHQLICVERNFSCRLGEIDLIMRDTSSNTLVFVEVRFRANAKRGNATESVNWKKQQKLRRTALHYLQKKANASTRARIDVIGISNTDTSKLNERESAPYVSEYCYQNHLLTWTRNAIES